MSVEVINYVADVCLSPPERLGGRKVYGCPNGRRIHRRVEMFRESLRWFRNRSKIAQESLR